MRSRGVCLDQRDHRHHGALPQAAALQRGLGGLSRTIPMRVPPAVIHSGVTIRGRHTDGAAYIIFFYSTKFENLEEERQLISGTALMDVRDHAGERVDQILARFQIARYEPETVGFKIPNFQILAVILFRASGVGASRAQELLQPLNHHMPRDQQQFDATRTQGRCTETFHAEANAGRIATTVWNDDPQPAEAATRLIQMVVRLWVCKTPGSGFGGRQIRRPLLKPLPYWARRGNLPSPTSTLEPMLTRLRTMRSPP
eukprot:8896549-Pyramimonas_sp.AAC.2